jgi:hypothetical protein
MARQIHMLPPVKASIVCEIWQLEVHAEPEFLGITSKISNIELHKHCSSSWQSFEDSHYTFLII